MDQQYNTEYTSKNVGNIEDYTIKECMVANIIYLIYNVEYFYRISLDFCQNSPRKEHQQCIDGETIRVIRSFKIVLTNKRRTFLENRWGINVDELTSEIIKFEENFKNFSSKESTEALDKLLKNTDNKENSILFSLSNYKSNVVLYNLALAEYAQAEKSHELNPYKSFIEQYEYLKYKIHDAATKNSEEYIAELRLNAFLDNYHEVSFLNFLKDITYITRSTIKCHEVKKLEKAIKEKYNEFKQGLCNIPSNLCSLDINIFKTISKDSHNSKMFEFFIFCLCKNSKELIYYVFHIFLTDTRIRESHNIFCVGKSLYEGYINWCKKLNIKPLIEVNETQLIDYPSRNNNLFEEQYHFPRKRFIDNPINEKREKLNIIFLEKLHQGMIDERMIDKDTSLEMFIFVFGYGGDKISNFKPIKILKPVTNYTRENGKRTIRYLLEELMQYNDEEIRPLIKKDKHLVLNRCFTADKKFKSSDFSPTPIYQGEQITKIKEIYENAFNYTKAKEI